MEQAMTTADLLPLPEPFTALPLTGSQTTSVYVWTSDQMQQYALAHLMAERERCAKVCEANADACDPGGLLQLVLRSNAAAIREGA